VSNLLEKLCEIENELPSCDEIQDLMD